MKTLVTAIAIFFATNYAFAGQEIIENNYGGQTIRLITNADGCYDTAPFAGDMLVTSITSSIEKLKLCKEDKLMVFNAQTGDLMQIATPQQVFVRYTFMIIGAASEIEYVFSNGLRATSYSHIIGHTRPGLCTVKKDIRVCVGQTLSTKQFGAVSVIGLTELGTAIITDQKGIVRLLGGAKPTSNAKNRWNELYLAPDFENEN